MEPNGKTKVLIAGGGVAGLEAALALRELAVEHVAVELLAPEMHFWYKPAAAAAPFDLGAVTRFELNGLARQIGASFTPGGLTGIDAWRHVAYTSTNTQIAYDVLLVACGALPFPSVPGALTFEARRTSS
jgi:sulfide:quinone oxidoreductase